MLATSCDSSLTLETSVYKCGRWQVAGGMQHHSDPAAPCVPARGAPEATIAANHGFPTVESIAQSVGSSHAIGPGR